MRFYISAVHAIALFLPFTLHAQECSSPLIKWRDYDQTLINLSTAYNNESYVLIESALNCLMNSKTTFTSGKPGSVATYWFYRNEMHAPGADETDELRIRTWKKTIKNSPYANFAELRLLYSQAWNARGTKYANDTSEDQFKRFEEKLLFTEQAILSEKNQLKDTAISYNLLMAVSLDAQGAKTSPATVFEAGVSKWPNYYDFYEVFLTRLVPKWGGSWEQVDAFISYWSKKLQHREKNSIYARLYYNVHFHNQVNPHSTKVDWNRLKPSLISLYTRYPVKTHYEIAASYACIFTDYSFYKQLTSINKVASSKAWLPGSSIEQCDEYFKSLPNKASPVDAKPARLSSNVRYQN